MRIWLTWLCLTLLATVYGKVVVKKIPVSELFPYPPAWNPQRTKPISEEYPWTNEEPNTHLEKVNDNNKNSNNVPTPLNIGITDQSLGFDLSPPAIFQSEAEPLPNEDNVTQPFESLSPDSEGNPIISGLPKYIAEENDYLPPSTEPPIDFGRHEDGESVSPLPGDNKHQTSSLQETSDLYPYPPEPSTEYGPPPLSQRHGTNNTPQNNQSNDFNHAVIEPPVHPIQSPSKMPIEFNHSPSAHPIGESHLPTTAEPHATPTEETPHPPLPVTPTSHPSPTEEPTAVSHKQPSVITPTIRQPSFPHETLVEAGPSPTRAPYQHSSPRPGKISRLPPPKRVIAKKPNIRPVPAVHKHKKIPKLTKNRPLLSVHPSAARNPPNQTAEKQTGPSFKSPQSVTSTPLPYSSPSPTPLKNESPIKQLTVKVPSIHPVPFPSELPTELGPEEGKQTPSSNVAVKPPLSFPTETQTEFDISSDPSTVGPYPPPLPKPSPENEEWKTPVEPPAVIPSPPKPQIEYGLPTFDSQTVAPFPPPPPTLPPDTPESAVDVINPPIHPIPSIIRVGVGDSSTTFPPKPQNGFNIPTTAESYPAPLPKLTTENEVVESPIKPPGVILSPPKSAIEYGLPTIDSQTIAPYPLPPPTLSPEEHIWASTSKPAVDVNSPPIHPIPTLTGVGVINPYISFPPKPQSGFSNPSPYPSTAESYPPNLSEPSPENKGWKTPVKPPAVIPSPPKPQIEYGLPPFDSKTVAPYPPPPPTLPPDTPESAVDVINPPVHPIPTLTGVGVSNHFIIFPPKPQIGFDIHSPGSTGPKSSPEDEYWQVPFPPKLSVEYVPPTFDSQHVAPYPPPPPTLPPDEEFQSPPIISFKEVPQNPEVPFDFGPEIVVPHIHSPPLVPNSVLKIVYHPLLVHRLHPTLTTKVVVPQPAPEPLHPPKPIENAPPSPDYGLPRPHDVPPPPEYGPPLSEYGLPPRTIHPITVSFPKQTPHISELPPKKPDGSESTSTSKTTKPERHHLYPQYRLSSRLTTA